ncbi:MAG: hypothetical protein ACRD12_23760 [Acidimicrobiales bacterium]
MRAAPLVLVGLLLGACGGGGSRPEPAPADSAAEVSVAIERVQASTKDGEPTAIRADCEGLRDTVEEARASAVDPGLQKPFDSLAAAARDCVRATTSGDTRLLERSITALRAAEMELDTAKAKL